MKKLLLVATLLVALPAQHLIAAPADVVQAFTWAFFKLSDIFGPDSKCEEWVEFMQEMEAEMKANQAELQRDEQAFQKAVMEAQKKEQAKLLNDISREAEGRKLQEMQNKAQQKIQKMKMDGERKQQAKFESIVQKIKVVLQRFKKEKNLVGFIVDSAWEVDPIADYTDEIIKELNEDYRKAKKARDAKKAPAKPAAKL
jgi:Skp family chaperone for outer membrane proteins